MKMSNLFTNMKTFFCVDIPRPPLNSSSMRTRGDLEHGKDRMVITRFPIAIEWAVAPFKYIERRKAVVKTLKY